MSVQDNKPADASATDIVAEIMASVSGLLRGEIALARAEIGESLRATRSAVVQLVIAAVLMLSGVFSLGQAAALWIVSMGLSPALAQLIVGGSLIVVASAFGQSGQTYLRDAMLASRRSSANLKRDIEALQTIGGSDGR